MVRMGDSLFSWWNDSFDQLQSNAKENLAFLKPITDALLTIGRLDDTIPPLCIETDHRWMRRSVVRYGSGHFERLMIEDKDREQRSARKRIHSGNDSSDDGGPIAGRLAGEGVTGVPLSLLSSAPPSSLLSL